MPITIQPAPFQISPSYGRLQIFGVGLDYNVYTKWKTTIDRNAAWSDWATLGGAIASEGELLVGYSSDGRMQIFCVSHESNIHSIWKTTTDANAPWSDWANLGGSTHYAGLSVGYLPDQRMQLFIFGDDGNIDSSWQTVADSNSDWSEWTSMGVPAAPSGGLAGILGNVSIGYLPDQRMQIFVVGSNGSLFSLWKITTDPGSLWTDWIDLGAIPGTGPKALGPGSLAIGYLPDHRMQIFYIGNDSSLYSTWKTTIDPDSSWSAWTNMGGTALNDVSVGYLPDGRMQIFATDQGGYVQSIWKTGTDSHSSWSNWANMGSVGSTISAVVGYLPDNSMQVFATTIVSPTLYTKWKVDNGPRASWSDWVSMGPLPENAGVRGVSIGYLPDDGP